MDLGLFVFKRYVQVEDVAVLVAGGEVALSATVVKDKSGFSGAS